jgi:hypothetical protein
VLHVPQATHNLASIYCLTSDNDVFLELHPTFFSYQGLAYEVSWETKWSIPWFDCDESKTWRGLNSNPGQFHFGFILPLFHLENHVCLSRGVQVVGAARRTAIRIMAVVGDLVQRAGDDRTGRVLGGRAIERSGGTVCGLHRARGNEERWFLDWALKPRLTVCEWFDLKTTRTVFAGLASKPVATVSSGLASKPAVTFFTGLASKPVTTVFAGLASKLVATVSSGLASKPAATVFSILASKLVVTVSPGLTSKPVVSFLVEPQNQGGGGFPGLGLKTGSSDLMIWL